MADTSTFGTYGCRTCSVTERTMAGACGLEGCSKRGCHWTRSPIVVREDVPMLREHALVKRRRSSFESTAYGSAGGASALDPVALREVADANRS